MLILLLLVLLIFFGYFLFLILVLILFPTFVSHCPAPFRLHSLCCHEECRHTARYYFYAGDDQKIIIPGLYIYKFLLLRRSPQFNLLEQMNDPGCSDVAKNSIQSFRAQVGEGWLVQQARVHGAVLGQVADDLLDEFDLSG